MWSEEKQQELDRLRHREQERELTSQEHYALDHLLIELEHEETIMLRPAFERLRQEQAQLRASVAQVRAENAVLSNLADRQAALLTRAKDQVAALLHEHEMLKAEYEQAMGQPLSVSEA